MANLDYLETREPISLDHHGLFCFNKHISKTHNPGLIKTTQTITDSKAGLPAQQMLLHFVFIFIFFLVAVMVE